MSTSSPEPRGGAHRYLMIGDPVSTVRTPPLLEARFAQSGIAVRIDTVLVTASELPAFMSSVRDDPAIDGLTVTMPHKRAIVAHVDKLSRTARLVGSVNAIKRLSGGGLAGAQFDGTGLVRAVSTAGFAVAGAAVRLAGFGGAGVPIAHALMAAGARSLDVVDPHVADDDIEATLDRLGRHGCDAGSAGRGRRPSRFDLLVNASPLGMNGEDDPAPFSGEQIAAASCVADIVADPPSTRLAAMARAAGLPFVSGRGVVAGQIEPIFAWLVSERVEQDDP